MVILNKVLVAKILYIVDNFRFATTSCALCGGVLQNQPVPLSLRTLIMSKYYRADSRLQANYLDDEEQAVPAWALVLAVVLISLVLVVR